MKQRKTSPKGSMIFVYCIMILLLMSLTVTATYTWFSISRTPRVSNIGIYVNAPTGLVLATTPDAEKWHHSLDYAELVPDTAPLRPVTWSEREQRFFAAQYAADGRRTDNWHPLTDDNNANRDDVYGYYIKASYFATTDTNIKISLTHAVEVEEGISGSGTFLIGTPVWNPSEIVHNDGGNGAQNAVRIGFRFTPVDSTGAATGDSTFYIYEPNCDGHVDGSTDYQPTPSIDGADSLVPADRLIRQTTTTWTETDPIQKDVLIRDMGEFENEPYLYTLAANALVRIDMYIWLEGQDVDCDNRIGRNAKILANVQFYADPGGQSGLHPIPDE